MTPEQVQRAAEILEEEASSEVSSFTNAAGVWCGDGSIEAKARHDECLELAQALRNMLARYRAAKRT